MNLKDLHPALSAARICIPTKYVIIPLREPPF